MNFSSFLEKFPEMELPFTLGDEAHHEFSQKNGLLPALMIEQFIRPLEKGHIDELTEFIACFEIPETHAFHAVVYWKASLMDYRYILATFTEKGILIDKRAIAGTYYNGQVLTKSIATIDEDWTILIVTGQASSNNSDYDASSSKAYHLELLPDGKIIKNLPGI